MLTKLRFSKFYSERVSMGRALDLPVFFGDAGSREVPPQDTNSFIVLSNIRLEAFTMSCSRTVLVFEIRMLMRTVEMIKLKFHYSRKLNA